MNKIAKLWPLILLAIFLICLLLAYLLRPKPLILQVKNREIVVNGKPSQVFAIQQLDGTYGLSLKKGDTFRVVVENLIDQPTGIHWHGLLLPNNQDGVPYITQPPILPGKTYAYDFPLLQAGTFWMHAHYGLEEQKLLAAPLILHDDDEDSIAQQEVVMFLSDFTFRNPEEIFKELRSQNHKNMPHNYPDNMKIMTMNIDINDVKYDAFLANWRTYSDPDLFEVHPGTTVRLRVINGSSSSNFFINLGKLKGEAIAVDGSPIVPLQGSEFELATAQRIDILIQIPSGNKFYPIRAQGEGIKMQAGLILYTPGIETITLEDSFDQLLKTFTYQQEKSLQAKNPLVKKNIDRQLIVNLDGDMEKYVWTINGKAWPDNEPLIVKEGERVEMIFVNNTSMGHPMHLHGHVFQATSINDQPFDGAMRDTILVLPKSTVKIEFDAEHPGIWPLHCHNLYHQYAGMMTTLNYEGFKGPVFSKAEMHAQ